MSVRCFLSIWCIVGATIHQNMGGLDVIGSQHVLRCLFLILLHTRCQSLLMAALQHLDLPNYLLCSSTHCCSAGKGSVMAQLYLESVPVLGFHSMCSSLQPFLPCSSLMVLEASASSVPRPT